MPPQWQTYGGIKGIMAIQTDIVGRVALYRHAVGYVRVSTKDQNEDTQVHQILMGND